MFINEKNLKNPHESEEFRELFIDGSVCFTNAYPVNRDDNIHYPSPLSLFKEKDRETYLDMAREEHWEQVVHGIRETKGRPRGFAYLLEDQDNLSIETMEVETEMEYHHSRPDDKSIGHAESQGEFFQFSVIKAGQYFKSCIIGEFEHLEKIK
jgi:CRISPR-associated protein Csx10